MNLFSPPVMWVIRATLRSNISRLFSSQAISSCVYAFKKRVQCMGSAEAVHWKGKTQRLHYHVTFSRHKCIT